MFWSCMPQSIERCSTNMSYSSNEPGSSNASMRSRAVSLPLACCASMRRWPPPSRAAARRRSSSFSMSCIPNSDSRVRFRPKPGAGLAEESLLVVLDLAHALQIENVLDGGDARLDAMDAALLADLGEGLAHGAYRSADCVVAPDQQADLLELAHPRHCHLRIGRRHQRDRRLAIPRLHKGLDLVCRLLLEKKKNQIGSRRLVGPRALQRFVLAEPGDQRLGARHEHEVLVGAHR